jgi:hypothetical protein
MPFGSDELSRDRTYHSEPPVDMRDAPRRAVALLEPGIALDSSFASAVQHLPVLYWELGDSGIAQMSGDPFHRTYPDFGDLPVSGFRVTGWSATS